MRIVGDVGQRGTRGRNCGSDCSPVGVDVSSKRNEVSRVARAADEIDVEIALNDAARLADLAAIHPDEIRRLG